MIIGITGGTGCGKTTALDAIRRLGGTVFDCDQIYHDLLKTDKALLKTISLRFPGTVIEGELQRKALGAIVFSDPEALKDLNRITHHAVCEVVEGALGDFSGLAAIDAIGLFESDLARLCDITVSITAPEEDRVTRLMARDGISEEYARMRISAQKPQDYFREHCDYTLENDRDAAAFSAKCLAFFRQFVIMEETTHKGE